MKQLGQYDKAKLAQLEGSPKAIGATAALLGVDVRRTLCAEAAEEFLRKHEQRDQCDVSGCANLASRCGVCRKHYIARRRAGTLIPHFLADALLERMCPGCTVAT